MSSEPTFSVCQHVLQPLRADFVTAAGAASDEDGFDIPMGFSSDGDNLFVTRWSGTSFQEPGKPVLQIVNASGRASYENFTRFYGWAAR